MRSGGIWLAVLGLAGMIYGLTMNTTVASHDGTRVHNIGLMDDRRAVQNAAGFVFLAGVVLIGFGSMRPREPGRRPAPMPTTAERALLPDEKARADALAAIRASAVLRDTQEPISAWVKVGIAAALLLVAGFAWYHSSGQREMTSAEIRAGAN